MAVFIPISTTTPNPRPIETLVSMGIHTGESIVVAPSQTLSDVDNQRLRNASIKIIRALQIQGGCNIQFAVHPDTGDYKVIEVNPRVSRSSALASKATGYPIAKISSKIAVGMTLDEIQNDITKETPASFEPSLDYVVAKVPRWPFDKFKGIKREIGVQMQSTGEVMAIGRTAEEALHKAIRSLDIGKNSFEEVPFTEDLLRNATDQRIFHIYSALKSGMTVEELHAIWIASESCAELIVLNVVETSSLVGLPAEDLIVKITEMLKEEGKQAIEKIGDMAKTSEIEPRCGETLKVTSKTKEGSPAEAILKTIEEEDIDLVVMGTSGKHGQRFFPQVLGEYNL